MGGGGAQEKTMVRDLTEGSIPKLLLRFALPLLAANALQALYNLVDMVVVGQYMGGAGMSAVSVGGDLLHLITFIAMGFSSAGQVLIARDVGAGRMDQVKKTIGNLFFFLFTAALVIAAVCLVFRGRLLDLVNTPAKSYDYTMDYFLTCSCGLVFIYGYNCVSAILRGMGDSRRPFVFIAIAAVLNTVLDILFVIPCGMGVFGAALATVIGQGTSFVLSIIYLYKRREMFHFDFNPASFRPDAHTMGRLVGLGIPMSIQSMSVTLSKTVLMSWINSEGMIYSALAGVYNKTGTMFGIVSNSFTTAGSSMIGQNLGAGRNERVPKIMGVVLSIGMGMATVFSALLLMFQLPFYEIFTTDEEVLAEVSILTFPIILNLFGGATRSGGFALINGTGRSKLNLFVAIFDGMISRIGIAALLYFTFKMGALGCWYGDALAGFMPIVIGGIFFLSGKWKTPAPGKKTERTAAEEPAKNDQ